MARFITADTIVPDWTNPQTLNRYSYCVNNPLKYVDPSGHGFFDFIKDLFIEIVSVVAGTIAGIFGGPEVGFLVYNAVSSAANAIRYDTGFKGAFQGFVTGGIIKSFGIAVGTQKFFGSGLIGKTIYSSGASIQHNLTSGREWDSQFTFSLGPIFLTVQDGEFHTSPSWTTIASLASPKELSIPLKIGNYNQVKVLEKGHLWSGGIKSINWLESLSQGTLVFQYNRQIPGLQGQAIGDVIWTQPGAGIKTIKHELMHTFQHRQVKDFFIPAYILSMKLADEMPSAHYYYDNLFEKAASSLTVNVR